MPNQKCGSESPPSATVLATQSVTRPGRTAAATPAGTPITIANTSESTASSSVIGSRCSSWVDTGMSVIGEVPSCPLSTWPIHRTYCTGSGWSKP